MVFNEEIFCEGMRTKQPEIPANEPNKAEFLGL